jgi:hypothetical protein
VGPNIAALARQANVNDLLPKPLVSRDIAKALAKAFGKQHRGGRVKDVMRPFMRGCSPGHIFVAA